MSFRDCSDHIQDVKLHVWTKDLGARSRLNTTPKTNCPNNYDAPGNITPSTFVYSDIFQTNSNTTQSGDEDGT